MPLEVGEVGQQLRSAEATNTRLGPMIAPTVFGRCVVERYIALIVADHADCVSTVG